MRSILPTTTRSIEGSLLSNLSHLDPPQMLLQNTEKGSITLFKVGAKMMCHLNNRMENVKWDLSTSANDKTSCTTWASEDNQM